MFPKVLALLLSLCAILPASSAEPKELTEANWQQLVKEDPTLHLPKAIAFFEAKLDRVYRANLAEAEKQQDPEQQGLGEALVQAQKAWRAWEKADAAFAALEAAGTKTVGAIDRQLAERHLYLLRLRAYEIDISILQGWVDMPAVAEPELAANPGPITDRNWRKYGDKGPKIYLPKVLDFFQAKLERIYQKRLVELLVEARPAFEAAQAAWRVYHEADGIYGAISVLGGSGAAPFSMERHTCQLRLRIYQMATPFATGWMDIPSVPEPTLPNR